MARTVAYQYYTDAYHGTVVAEDEWDHAALLASAHLDRLKAIATVTPYRNDEEYAESMAICAMAEVIDTWNATTTGSGGVASEHIGSVTVSYANPEQVMPKGLGPALMASVRPWLHVKVATMPYA